MPFSNWTIFCFSFLLFILAEWISSRIVVPMIYTLRTHRIIVTMDASNVALKRKVRAPMYIKNIIILRYWHRRNSQWLLLGKLQSPRKIRNWIWHVAASVAHRTHPSRKFISRCTKYGSVAFAIRDTPRTPGVNYYIHHFVCHDSVYGTAKGWDYKLMTIDFDFDWNFNINLSQALILVPHAMCVRSVSMHVQHHGPSNLLLSCLFGDQSIL